MTMIDERPQWRYTTVAIALHWLIALLIISGFSMGLYMVDLPVSPAKLQYYSWHKWIGITIFLLAFARAGWRFLHPPPAPVAGQPPWQVQAAAVTHALLYLLLFAIPLSGWLYSSAAGFQTVYLGLVPIPDLIGKESGLKDLLKNVHWSLTLLLAVLIAVHVIAALKHQIIDRDGTLSRMLPGRIRSSP